MELTYARWIIPSSAISQTQPWVTAIKPEFSAAESHSPAESSTVPQLHFLLRHDAEGEGQSAPKF